MTQPPRSAPALPAATPVVRDTRMRAWHLLVHGLEVAAANFAIAVLVSTANGGRFGGTLAYVEIIGLCIWLVAEFGRLLMPQDQLDGWPLGWRKAGLIAAACVIGYVVGVTIVDAIRGRSNWPELLHDPSRLLTDVALTVTFAAVISGWFYTRSRAQVHRAQAAAALHDATLARLVLLQSQLEPHMLFNTLANLRALIGADPERAQAMLDRLIDFLRATLAASRVAAHPLKDEFARVADYLALMKVRMGDRLDTALDLPPDLAALPVPPLLLQPLVENAIKHGLEPKRGPGTLRVTAAREGQTLVLAVVDSGRGLAAAARSGGADVPPDAWPGSGFGLAQVRERLQTLHGDAARFTLADAPGGGTRAEIRLPLAAPADAPHPTLREDARP